MHIAATTGPVPAHAHRHADGTNHVHTGQTDRHRPEDKHSASAAKPASAPLGRQVDVQA